MTSSIEIDAITALIISNELDPAELLADIKFAQSDELPQIADALNESLKTPLSPDHAERLISILHSDSDLFTGIALSLEICPIHACDQQICIDDQIAECSDFHH